MIILILVLGFPHVEAQASTRQDFTPNLKPNLGVAFAILGTLILMTSIIFYFSKFCQTSPTIRNQQEIAVGDFVTGSRSSGIDKKVIESLPFFNFSLLKGSKEGLECAVCLSKFEDIEVLRLLPKCQHAFHINCIDKWLEEHSSCPLCRSQVSANDLESLTSSTSLRFLPSFSDSHVETNLEIVIERENWERGSSRVTLESRSRESARSKKEKLLMRKMGAFRNSKVLRKFNHKIIVSDVVSKNRWSDLSSSDLLVLESEMLGSTSSKRFSCLDNNDDTREIMNREEEIDMKSVSENKAGEISGSRVLNQNERRSMSEITVHTRFDETENVPFVSENAVKEEKIKRIWLPMARETVEWLVKREKSQYTHIRRPSLNV